jgi:hypothetical protein
MATDKEKANDGDAIRRTPDTDGVRDTSTSYGATEREQTEDLRRRNPQADRDVADGGVSEELERDSDWPVD